MKNQPIQRFLLVFAFCALALTLATAPVLAQAPQAPNFQDLLHHERTFQGKEVRQAAAMLFLPTPTNGWASAAQLSDFQVQAALDWCAEHGYLFDDPSFDIDFVSDGNGNSIAIHGPGTHVVINLPSGPFLPTQHEQLMVITIIRQAPQVSNGF